jgi:hypothetical protein
LAREYWHQDTYQGTSDRLVWPAIFGGLSWGFRPGTLSWPHAPIHLVRLKNGAGWVCPRAFYFFFFLHFECKLGLDWVRSQNKSQSGNNNNMFYHYFYSFTFLCYSGLFLFSFFIRRSYYIHSSSTIILFIL